MVAAVSIYLPDYHGMVAAVSIYLPDYHGMVWLAAACAAPVCPSCPRTRKAPRCHRNG